MRITYLYDGTYPSSGADAWQVLNTACALSRQGASVRLAFCRAPDRAPLSLDALLAHYGIDGDIELLQLPTPRIGGRGLAKLAHPVRAILRDAARTTDLFYTRNIPALVVANLLGRPVVYDTYRPWPSQSRAMKVFFRHLFRRPSVLGAFFHSHHTMESFAGAGIDRSRLRVAHNGHNAKFFADPLSTRDARALLGLDPDAFVIGYTGRLDAEKGIHALLDILERAPEFEGLLVGGGKEPDVMARIAGLANVTLFEWQKPQTLSKYLYACDCLLIPPSSTPLQAGNTVLPMKLFAYFASGRPIVAPRAPDTAELLRHDENAWLLQPGEPEDAVRQLQLLRDDPQLRRRLGHTARAESVKMTWDHRAMLLLTQIDEWLRAAAR